MRIMEEGDRFTREEALTVLLNATADALFLMDRAGRVIVANAGACRLFEVSPAAIEGTSLYRLLPRPVALRSRRNLRVALKEGKPVRAEVLWGGRYYDTTIYPVSDDQAHRIRLAVFISDVTERKKVEKTLLETEQKYRNIFQNATEGIFQVSREGRFMSANPSLARIHGYDSPEELIETITDIASQLYVNAGDRKALVDTLDRQGWVRDMEIQMYRKDRSLHWISMNARVVRDESGRALYHEGTMQDITERKMAEEALLESEERYRTAIEHSNDGVAIIQGMTHQYVNRRFVEMFGYQAAEEIVGQPVGFQVHPDDREKVIDINERRQRGWFVPHRYEFKAIRKDGRELYVEVSATSIFYRGSHAYLVYLRDITDRKRAEESLLQSHRELERLNRVKTKAVNHISHELRTPLAVIQGNVRLLKRRLEGSPWGEQFQHLFGLLERNLERLYDLYRETEEIFRTSLEVETGVILDELDRLWERMRDVSEPPQAIRENWDAVKGWLGRNISGSTMAFQSIDLLPFVQRAAERFRGLTGHRRLSIETEGENDLFISIDPVILREVCDGLVKNAVESTPDGGTVKITVEQKGERILLHVADSGVGITEENQKSIFDGLFHTEETALYASKRPFEFGAGGKGLELMRMKMYGRRFGFDVSVRSNRCPFLTSQGDACPGDTSLCPRLKHPDDCLASGGTTFTVSFPAGRNTGHPESP